MENKVKIQSDNSNPRNQKPKGDNTRYEKPKGDNTRYEKPKGDNNRYEKPKGDNNRYEKPKGYNNRPNDNARNQRNEIPKNVYQRPFVIEKIDDNATFHELYFKEQEKMRMKEIEIEKMYKPPEDWVKKLIPVIFK